MRLLHQQLPVRRPPRILAPALVATAVLLAGCAAGPDFTSPARDEAGRYRVAAPEQATVQTDTAGGDAQSFSAGAPIAADWYRVLQAPVLDALIHRALQDNASLAASQASLRSAGYQLRAVSGSSWPDADLGAGASRQHSNGAPVGLDSPLFNGVFNLYTTQLQLGYDLDLFGATRREVEAQQAQFDYQQNLLRGSLLTLVDNVVVTTVRYAALQDRLKATHDIIAAQQAEVGLLEKQEKAGSAAYADVLRARAELANSQVRLPALQHQLAVTRHALARLVNADPASFTLPALSLDALQLPTTLPVSVPSALVQQRPDILAAEQQLHAANAAVGMATANLYPRLRLSAAIGGQTNSGSTLFESPSQVWSLGASLTAPLFHGGSLRNQRQAAKQKWQAQYAQYQQVVLNAFTQVADVLDAIHQDAAVLKAQDHALTATRDSMELVRKQYHAGAAGYLDVLAAERLYNQSLLAHIDAVSQRFVDTAALYHALGGGWWNMNATADEQGDNTSSAQPSSVSNGRTAASGDSHG